LRAHRSSARAALATTRPFRPAHPFVRSLPLIAALLALATSPAAHAGTYAPHIDEDFPTEVFFGDTHVHSSFSMDANSMGNTRLTPADAYRYARGEKVMANSGMEARLEQPLDFLVVSDHSEYMGLLPRLRAGDPRVLGDPVGRELSEGLQDASDGGMAAMGKLIGSLMSNQKVIDNQPLAYDIWREITRMADAANDPGRFTALIGFEWTSMPNGDNLHRVVVYGDGADRAGRNVPVSAFDSERPEDLWAFMERYAAETGGRILAIPHNANLSNGRMFALEDSDGRAFDAAYAKRRARHEPLVEVTQIKGDGETHPALSPEDPFADFENWDHGNLNILKTVPKEPWMLRFEYARSALRLGLDQAARTGTNPFQFGMIGSSDAHTSLGAVAEDDFWGKASNMEPGPRAQMGTFAATGSDPDEMGFDIWDFVASGYAAVWAKENTREAIFDAMQRREVYATTGSRIRLRLFGGWDFDEDDAVRPDADRIGYRKGVPMGGTLPAREGEAKAPRFLVSALKDPVGPNLDRIQIVKGWREADGSLAERVYDVALSDGRRAFFGRIRPIASTVDAEHATFTNDVGDAMLAAWWQDPDFDPAQHAFYYARVIEIPRPRWTVYDAVRLDAVVPKDVPKSIQDRAYSSPIWYTPGAR